MPTPRSQQISLSDTPYYHCISRCVRRTFLCGTDATTNKDYSHRKQWIVERLALLSKTFAIEVCAYAIMSNHSHTVLKINESLAQSWPDEILSFHGCLDLPMLSEEPKRCIKLTPPILTGLSKTGCSPKGTSDGV